MDLYTIFAILITLTAVFSYINYRYIHLPTTIGVMLISLLMSLGLIGLGWLGLGIEGEAAELLKGIDFNKILLQGMLGILLFAGALHININDLAQQKWVILSLATVGVIASTFMVGGLTWLLLNLLEIQAPLIYCLLFGALISPTDPIAVIGIMKGAGTSKSLQTKIVGESLFNDGIGVVVFIVLLGIATGGHEVTAGEVGLLFAEEAIGGAILGLLLGMVSYWMLKSVDNYQVEILITLALVVGGYALAGALHTSGAIAMVVAGLLIGNHGRSLAMSEKTREHLDTFWELIDEILNGLLFVLIGLEVLVLTFTSDYLLAGLIMIPLVLLVRFVTVGIPVTLLRFRRTFTPHVVKIMTWSGLRGGISVALALSIPSHPARDVLLVITYTIVVFSIVVQGLTVGRVIKRFAP